MIMQEFEIIKLLQEDGFSAQEIESILQGMKDIEQKNVFTAEEVYASLCDKKITYA